MASQQTYRIGAVAVFAIFAFIVYLGLKPVSEGGRLLETAAVAKPSPAPSATMRLSTTHTVVPLAVCKSVGFCAEWESCTGHEPKLPHTYVFVRSTVVAAGPDTTFLDCEWESK